MDHTHSKLVGYLLWIFGFIGAHRFYYGRPISGTLYSFTPGLLLIGLLYDLWTRNQQIDEVSRNRVWQPDLFASL